MASRIWVRGIKSFAAATIAAAPRRDQMCRVRCEKRPSREGRGAVGDGGGGGGSGGAGVESGGGGSGRRALKACFPLAGSRLELVPEEPLIIRLRLCAVAVDAQSGTTGGVTGGVTGGAHGGGAQVSSCAKCGASATPCRSARARRRLTSAGGASLPIAPPLVQLRALSHEDADDWGWALHHAIHAANAAQGEYRSRGMQLRS